MILICGIIKSLLTQHMTKVYDQYFEGKGEMARLTRAFDWSSTSIGNPENWSQSLLTTISIILNSRFPMFLWWGTDLVQFYNDAYRPSLGNEGKHPKALGQKGVDCWAEIWPVIKPLIDQVMAGGESTWSENQLIPIYRNNTLEDVYWTFSYSRVNDESGKPAGVLVICNETTAQIKAFKELSGAKQELDFAIEAAELATWDLNPTTNKFLGNARLKSWFGLDPDKEIELSKALEIIHDKDREYVKVAIKNALIFESGGNYDIDYTIQNPKNKVERIVRAKGKALFDDQNQPYRFSGTLQDITEQKTDEIRKSDFIGMVSHELKTPLTTIKAYIQVLRLQALKKSDDYASKALEKAEHQVKKMNTLISGFLNVSRFESGKIHLQMENFCLNDLIEETINEAHIFNSTHHISYVTCDPIHVYADRDKIGTVISNLLSNAIKYSAQASTVEISCRIEEKKVEIAVKDEGLGINSVDQEKLFDRYYRIENKNTPNISGFGIGLYLSKEIIKRHKGEMAVESKPGLGSKFYFTIPHNG